METPKIKELVKKHAEDLINAQNLDEAQLLLNEYKTLSTDIDASIHSLQSIIYLMQNAPNKCIDYLKPIMDSVINSDLFYNLATAYEITGDYTSAISQYRNAQMTTFDMALRQELSKKIAQLQYRDATDSEIEQYMTYLVETKNYIKDQMSKPNTLLDPADYLKTENPFEYINKSIFLGTMEIANHMAQYTSTFRKQGHIVYSLNYHPNYLKYANDLNIGLLSLDENTRYQLSFLNALDIIAEYQYFHFTFNMTLMLNKTDLVALKQLKKSTFMHNLGSEIRIPSVARKHHKYWSIAEKDYLSQLNEESIVKNLKICSTYIDNVIVNDFEMYSYVKDYYKNVYFVGLPITLDEYKYSPVENDKLILVHAPTNPAVKGSEFFLKAVNNLKDKYDFEFIKVQGYSHEEAKAIYRKADIILDELVIGTYGSLTIESLSMGKCVVTHLNETFNTPHNEEVPVQIATADNVETKIEELLLSKELRQSLAERGRKYVETHCDVNVICKQLFKIYTGKTQPYKA